MADRLERFLIALSLAGLTAVSCRTAPVPPSSAPRTDAVTKGSDLVNEDSLSWSSSSPLRWPDYRARPPAGHDEAAVTVTGLVWGYRCVDDAFSVHVAAAFFPDRSWVNPLVFVQPGSSQRTLQHEQTHFDLTEVYARLTRQFFRELSRPCDRSEDELASLGQRFVRDELDAQRRYDQETANGRDAGAQAGWDRRVHEQLETLKAFAAE